MDDGMMPIGESGFRQYNLPEGRMAVKIPIARTTAGEVRISNQLLSDRFAVDPPLAPRMRRARFWLRVRTIRLRERVATWIAPWLCDEEW
jgi:hypothetical protein